MRRASVFGLDLLILSAATIALLLFLSGGGVFEWHGHLVRAERARNPLLFLFALLALRYGLGGRAPFLGRGPMERWLSALARAVVRLRETLGALDAGAARRLVIAVALASAVAKLWNIWRYYGFVFGDDVEVHLMTFSVLRGRDLGVWNLRSPVYPLLFIYPVQKLLSLAGARDPGLLVAGGRMVVAAFSLLNVGLVYRVGVAIFERRAIGVLAAYLLAVSRLHVHLGSTELPRTVTTTFLLLAFLALRSSRGLAASALAGVALGVAASLRFSEAVFALPVALDLARSRRARDLAIAGAAALATMALALGPGDLLFWPGMFSSLRHIVDFTLVRGESSRGFEPLAHYLIAAPVWSDPLFLLLLVAGWRAAPGSLRSWAVAPIVALSLFPHKEERYLLPVLPFLVLVAAAGAWRLLEAARAHPESHRPLLAAFALAGVTCLEGEDFRFRRSESAVDVARFLAARGDARDVAMEEAATTTGASLYLLPSVAVVNVDSRRVQEGAYFFGIVARPQAQYVVLRAETLRAGYLEILRDRGFSEIDGPRARYGQVYRIFERSP